jgi:hypothetical protein
VEVPPLLPLLDDVAREAATVKASAQQWISFAWRFKVLPLLSD